jgi:hypothetical protein
MTAPVTPKHYDLVVTGDVFVHHHLYEGDRDRPTDQQRGVHEVREPGGAKILSDLVRAALKKNQPEWSVHLGVESPMENEPPGDRHAYGFWSPHLIDRKEKKKPKKDQTNVWRVKLQMGYGASEAKNGGVPKLKAASTARPRANVLVLDDTGFEFRRTDCKDLWLLPDDPESGPDWIVLKMSGPIAHGHLWHQLIPKYADRVICLVSVDELRQENVSISCGLSWERTAEDVRTALLEKSALAPLRSCRHLIVRLCADGALWLDSIDQANPTAKLIFDAGSAEGGWKENHPGTVIGSSATLAAAVACGLAQHVLAADKLTSGNNDKDNNDKDNKKSERRSILSSIKKGLAAVRDLHKLGHGEIDKVPVPGGFPVDRLAEIIAVHNPAAVPKVKSGEDPKITDSIKQDKKDPEAEFADDDVPWPTEQDPLPTTGRPWMIVERAQRHPFSPRLVTVARQAVLHGKRALLRYPHAEFGDLGTIDRSEIETLRSVRRLMIAYEENTQEQRPLSIGVFGPPGAGKSFGVKQLAKEIFGDNAWIEFNLSQFDTKDAKDLIGAFHQVRDKVLSGVTPVVFWDEFDSKSLYWLQYLLAPMQDGRFLEGQVSHWIGKCVFVFAGGTSATYQEFALPENAKGKDSQDYKLNKGPDFHSRLDGYYNVVGPNRRAVVQEQWPLTVPKPDPNDVCFPLRRAMFIRSKLADKDKDKEPLDFDSDLLHALLLVPEYKHGARSLEKMIAGLRPNREGPIRRSALPPAGFRSMYVNEKVFNELLERDVPFLMAGEIDGLAEAIHEFWREQSKKDGWKMEDYLDRPYDQLASIDQEDNRAAARRIPKILALVGLALIRPESVSSDDPSIRFVRSYIESAPHFEILAEAEHIGWMEQRLVNGWRRGDKRDNEKLIHPLLKPYDELTAKEKEKDRDAIRHIPDMVRLAGYRFAWLDVKQSGQTSPAS